MVQAAVGLPLEHARQIGLHPGFAPGHAIVEELVVGDDLVGRQVVELPRVRQQVIQQRGAGAVAPHDEDQR
jgi:hypothetical protein